MRSTCWSRWILNVIYMIMPVQITVFTKTSREKVGVHVQLLVFRNLSCREVYFWFDQFGYVNPRKGSFLNNFQIIFFVFPLLTFSSLPHFYFSTCFCSMLEESFVTCDTCLVFGGSGCLTWLLIYMIKNFIYQCAVSAAQAAVTWGDA